MAKGRWLNVPIPTHICWQTVFEHTPLDFPRYGEYPRHIRAVRNECRQELQFLITEPNAQHSKEEAK